MSKAPLDLFLDIVQVGYSHGLLVRFDEALPSPEFTHECELPNHSEMSGKIDRVYLFPRNSHGIEGDDLANLNLGLYTTLVSLYDARREGLENLWRWTTPFPSQEKAVPELVAQIHSQGLSMRYQSALQERNLRIEEMVGGLKYALGLIAIRHWQTMAWEKQITAGISVRQFRGFSPKTRDQ